MKFKIKHRWTKEVLFSTETKNFRSAVEIAIESGADLSRANLSGADLTEANLTRANLSEADLTGANLTRANLSGAYLTKTNLSGADLTRTNLDFSSGLRFHCSSFNIRADLRLAAQLAYHFCKIDFGTCEDAVKAQEAIKNLANKFHRIGKDVEKII